MLNNQLEIKTTESDRIHVKGSLTGFLALVRQLEIFILFLVRSSPRLLLCTIFYYRYVFLLENARRIRSSCTHAHYFLVVRSLCRRNRRDIFPVFDRLLLQSYCRVTFRSSTKYKPFTWGISSENEKAPWNFAHRKHLTKQISRRYMNYAGITSHITIMPVEKFTKDTRIFYFIFFTTRRLYYYIPGRKIRYFIVRLIGKRRFPLRFTSKSIYSLL